MARPNMRNLSCATFDLRVPGGLTCGAAPPCPDSRKRRWPEIGVA